MPVLEPASPSPWPTPPDPPSRNEHAAAIGVRSGYASAYRADIDGLRAVAVLAVVLYHAGVPGFSGGFVGVDVFFVISGFLITGILLGDLDAGRYSIRRFYERRARRILPALFAMVAASAVAGYDLVPPDRLANLGDSTLATALFSSNMLFWLQSGYFAGASEYKPLLHTWSLAVEEQFYIAFPLILALLHARCRERLTTILAAAVCGSFVLSAALTASHPAAAFFLAPPRAWELGIGALLATSSRLHSPLAHKPELSAALGLLLIVASVLFFNGADSFPGWRALLPCVGTALIIAAGHDRISAPARWLSTRPVVAIGLVSYSLYLWHWPILVFARELTGDALDATQTVCALGLTAVVSTLSWRYVERPFRSSEHGASTSRALVRAALATSACMTLGLSLHAIASHAIAKQGAMAIGGRETYRAGNCFLEEQQTFSDWEHAGSCEIRNGGKFRVLIWGDSFAAHYTHGLMIDRSTPPLNIVQLSAYSCPPVPGASIPWAPGCSDFNSHIDEALSRYRFDAVVLAARWERYWGRSVDLTALQQVVTELHHRGLRVILVGQGPSFGFSDPRRYVQRTGAPRAPVSPGLSHINSQLRLLRDYDGFYDPMASTCNANGCLLQVDGNYLYWDGGHYSVAGSDLAAKGLLATVATAIEPSSH